jgi:hypothetical protein
MSDNYTIQVKKRPWYAWLLAAIWLALEIFLVQNAVASSRELEPQAAMIFWISFAVLLVVGLVVWFIRRE